MERWDVEACTLFWSTANMSVDGLTDLSIYLWTTSISRERQANPYYHDGVIENNRAWLSKVWDSEFMNNDRIIVNRMELHLHWRTRVM